MRSLASVSMFLCLAACGTVSTTDPDASAPPGDAPGPTPPDGSVEPAGPDAGAPEPDAATPDQGQLQFNDLSKDLGSVTVGQQGLPFTTQVRNLGTKATGALVVEVAGDASAFQVDASDCEGSALSAAGECDVVVRFAPSAAGDRAVQIVVHDSTDAAARATLSLTAKGITPGALAIEPSQFSFDRMTIDETRRTRTFVVRNSGETTIQGLALSLDGVDDYELEGGSCDAVLAGGASCEATVSYSPGRGGDRTTSLVARATGIEAAAQLTGVGVGTIVVTKTGDGSALGTVTGSGLSCTGNTCTAEVDTARLTLQAAAPAHQARFMAWSAPCDTDATCSIPVEAARREVSVSFRQLTTLAVRLTGTGSVSADGLSCSGAVCTGEYLKDATVRLTAAPGADHRFGGFSGCTGGATTCDIVMTASKDVAATFIRQYQVTVDIGGTIYGDLLESPDRTSQGGLNWRHGARTVAFDAGHTLTLEARDYPGTPHLSNFGSWSAGPCAGQGQVCAFTVDRDVTVRATFVAEYSVRAIPSGTGRVTVEPQGYGCPGGLCYSTPTVVTIRAIRTNTCWSFSHWSGNSCAGAASTCTLTTNSAHTATAVYDFVQAPGGCRDL
jgi:hypothetical protein